MTTPTSSIASGSDNPAFSLEGDSLTITTTTTTTISPFQRIVVESSSGSGGVPTASGGRGLSLDDLKKLLEIAKQSSQSQQPNTGARGASGPSTGRGITISGRSGGGALQQITEGATGGASGLSSLLGALGNSGDLSSLLGALGNSGDLSSLLGALGNSGDLSSLLGALGNSGDLSSLLGALGNSGDLSSLLGALGNKDVKDQLSALISVLNGKGNTTLSSALNSMSQFSQAISNLLSATNASGNLGSAINTTMSVAQLIYYAATSEAARKSGQFCHKECGPSCMGNCGCPGCGCPKGECGCGWFGKYFCNLWGSICGVGSSTPEMLTELEKLEKRHGKSVLLIALSNLHLDVVGILAGSVKVSLPPIDDIEEECKRVSTDFVNILQRQTADLWCAAAVRFSSILRDDFWKGCIVKALSYPTEKLNEEKIEDLVYVISSGAGGKACSQYSTTRMAESLSDLKVICPKTGNLKNLGILQMAGITELITKVLWVATDEGSRPVWISTENIMTLIAIVCARSSISFASKEGEAVRICNNPQVKEFFAAARTERGGQGEAQTLQTSQQFVQLAERCFGNASQQRDILRDSRNVYERDALILSMSNRWLLAAGIRAPQAITQQPGAASAFTEVSEEELTAQGGEDVEIVI